jgi:hypothetical protein
MLLTRCGHMQLESDQPRQLEYHKFHVHRKHINSEARAVCYRLHYYFDMFDMMDSILC